jgi:hypothetical protein
MENKDSPVAAIAFQIEYSKSTGWLTSFLVPFVFSIFPYLGLSLMF